jgi:predicted nucleotidyltransferase
MYQVHVDEALLGEVVRRLVEAIDPDKIILFGSRARGDPRPDSDLDLLIIKASDEPGHRRDARAYRAVGAVGVPKDMLWFTPEEVQDWAEVKHHIISHAVKEGRVLYEKRPR